MMTQPSLFDAPERAKADAIAQVEANSPDFVETAYAGLHCLAMGNRTVTSLDVWRLLNANNYFGGSRPNHPRAMGAVFQRAKHAGLISPTNEWVKSGRVSDHNQMLRVWKSEVYRG